MGLKWIVCFFVDMGRLDLVRYELGLSKFLKFLCQSTWVEGIANSHDFGISTSFGEDGGSGGWV